MLPLPGALPLHEGCDALRERLVDRSAGEELHSFDNATPVWTRFFQSVQPPMLRWGFAGALALLILAWIGYRTQRSPGRALRMTLALSACITLGSGIMALGNHWTAERVTVGIVVGVDAQLRDGLHDESSPGLLVGGVRRGGKFSSSWLSQLAG